NVGDQVGSFSGAFAWTVQSGFIPLSPMEAIHSISRDGKVICGEKWPFQTYIWTPSGGTRAVPLPYSGAAQTMLSLDGRYVLGLADGTQGQEVWRWSDAGGLEV